MSRSTFALPCALLLSLAVCGLAEAGQRSGTYTNSSGRSGSYSQTFSRGNGAWQRQTQIDAANGKTYERSVSGSFDRDDHTRTRSVTGFGGRTRSESQTFSRGNGSWQRQTQFDAANGKTYDRSVSGSFDRDDHTLTRSVTGFDGRTRNGTLGYTPDH